MIDVTASFLLPRDVELHPMRDIDAEMRARFEHGDDDFALTRIRARAPSKIVDPDTAALLSEFRAPSTIVEAVLRFSGSRGADPETVLDAAFPMLRQLINARILVPPDAEEAKSVEAHFAPDDLIDGYRVVRMVHLIDDTEVYEVAGPDGTRAALKLARRGETRSMLTHEAAVLARIPDVAAPILGTGTVGDLPYAVLQWIDGGTAEHAAHTLRARGRAGSEALLGLLVSIADAYARLHDAGVLHGDVHPGNVLLTDGGEVRLIDFGFAAATDLPQNQRGGVPFFHDPELAAARLRRGTLPRVTAIAEQYSLAALLYLLLTGSHYTTFSAEKEEAFRQVVEVPALPLHGRGVIWPELDAVLRRALEKDPARRFSSVRTLAEALAAIPLPSGRTLGAEHPLVRDFVARTAMDGPLWGDNLPAPTASVTYGAAGIAYALLRIALARNDAALLATADLWIERAAAERAREDAFFDRALGIRPEIMAPESLMHTAAGLHVGQVLVAAARNDPAAHQEALHAFAEAAGRALDSDVIDMTLGIAGLLTGCAIALATSQEVAYVDAAPLGRLGDTIASRLASRLAALGPVGSRDLPQLGFAHGWSGVLYALLSWSEVSGGPLPEFFDERLSQLAAHAERSGERIEWRIRTDAAGERMPQQRDASWCNGSAGHALLWSAMYRRSADPSHLELARGAGVSAYEDVSQFDSLCCGLAGRAYALLSLFQATNDPLWLERAEALATRAAHATTVSEMPNALYKGTAGVVTLLADLEHPETGVMPLVGVERV